MSGRRAAIHIATKAGISFGALFIVSVVLAAIPAHQGAPAPISTESSKSAQQLTAQPSAQESQSGKPATSSMPGMDMCDDHSAEAAAMHDMSPGGHDPHSLHMYMTEPRPQSPGDVQRSNEIVSQLRAGIEKYRDYHVALDEGFVIFHPEIPQPE